MSYREPSVSPTRTTAFTGGGWATSEYFENLPSRFGFARRKQKFGRIRNFTENIDFGDGRRVCQNPHNTCAAGTKY